MQEGPRQPGNISLSPFCSQSCREAKAKGSKLLQGDLRKHSVTACVCVYTPLKTHVEVTGRCGVFPPLTLGLIPLRQGLKLNLKLTMWLAG